MSAKRILSLVLLVFLVATFACSSGEKTEDDYIHDLKYKSRRSLALQRLAAMKSKKAIPYIIKLIDHRYSVKECVKALGLIGDPVVLPKLKELLDKVKYIDSTELDRLTEEIAVALGRIGDKKAAPWLISMLDDPQVGPWGRAGAIRGLAIMGATEAIEPLIDLMLNEKRKITNRLMAIKALFMLAHQADKIKPELRQKLIKSLMVAMFIEENKLNLFRESKEVMAVMVGYDDDHNGKSDVIEWLIKTYKNENEEVNKYTDWLAENFGFSKGFVQVKAIDAIGFLRNPDAVDFLVDEVLNPDTPFEISAKIAQALERIGDKRMNPRIVKWLIKKPKEDVRVRELLIRALSNTGDTSVIPKIFPILEKGNRILEYETEDPKTHKVVKVKKSVPNECLAAGYTIATMDDGTYLERFRKAVKSGKCHGDLAQVIKRTAEGVLEQLLKGLEVAATCKKDPDCYIQKMREAKAQPGSDPNWGIRLKAVRMLATLRAYDKADALIEMLADRNDIVRFAAVDAVFRLLYNATDKAAARKVYEKAKKFWLEDKNVEYTENAFLQKATEELGYTLHIIRQKLGIKEPVYVPFQ